MTKTTESRPGDETDASYAAWRAEVDKALKGADFKKRLVTRTLEGIDVQPLYTALDWPGVDDAAGFAGGAPYRRGRLAIGQHGAGRDLRTRYEQAEAGALRQEIADDLAHGAKSLWLGFDAGARAGQASVEFVEARGVPCLTAAQLGELLAEVPLRDVSVVLDAGGNALAVAACFLAAAKARGIASSQLEGSFQADPLGALARDGALPFSLESAREQLTTLAAWTSRHAPGMRAVSVSAVPYHDAGAHAAQELAYALATGVSYLRWLCDKGLTLSAACAQLSFNFSVGSDFFMEIAKLRAMRQCWAHVVQGCGGTAEDQNCLLHATTSTRTKTKRDPWVNLLRETTEAFSAAAGGADAITTGSFDRLGGPSTAFSRRIARNAQLVLDEEAQVTRVADPAGGSFYVETLTDALAQRAWTLFQSLEAHGGMLQALRSGTIAAQITEVADARDQQIAKRKQVVTGVSEFANVHEDALTHPAIDRTAIHAQRQAALASASKNDTVAKPVLDARNTGKSVVEAAIEAAAAGADLGQLSCALADAGEPLRIAALPVRRHARAYERLRDACDAYEQKTGKKPSVFLCNLGKIPEHKARAQFATGFFNAGGLEVVDNEGFSTPEAAAQAFGASGAALAVLCGSDDAYAVAAAQYTPQLLARGAKRVLLAGRPGEAEARYRAAGISDFIFIGCDVVQGLTGLLTTLEVL